MVVYSKKKKALKAHCDSVDCPIVKCVSQPQARIHIFETFSYVDYSENNNAIRIIHYLSMHS